MAKLKNPLMSMSARGIYANSLVYSNSKGNHFVKFKNHYTDTIKFNPRTDIQQINRKRLANATFFYQFKKNTLYFLFLKNGNFKGSSIYNKVCSYFLLKNPAFYGLTFYGDSNYGEDISA